MRSFPKSDTRPPVRVEDIAALVAAVGGPVLTPDHESYLAECAVYNLTVTHRPAVVVGATGHQAIVPADGAVLITTSRIAAIAVDPQARTVRIEAGVRWRQVVDAAAEHGLAPLNPVDPAPFLERTALIERLTPETVDTIIELAGPDADCPVAFIELRQLGGALSRPPELANAVGNRDAAFAFWIVSIGMPEDAASPMSYADTVLDRLAPWCTDGKHLNFMSTEDTSVERVRQAYSAETYQRLRSVKAAYDPTNLFRLNHNIPPQP
ncbi:MAG: BBE domain-containing protein [Pseudonocardiaceae bacterium]